MLGWWGNNLPEKNRKIQGQIKSGVKSKEKELTKMKIQENVREVKVTEKVIYTTKKRKSRLGNKKRAENGKKEKK